MAPTTASGVPPKRVTRRRAQTRDRLLAAAYEVFAAEGFGRSTVEKVCEQAGFTRGAFYSNFGSLDELFLAMWEHRSAQLLADVRAALDGIATDGVTELRVMIERLAGAVPVDEAWFRITAEFTAHALRDPGLRRVVAAREAAILEALMPPVVATLAGRGRAVPDPVALGQALVAVHDGTAVQVLLEPRSRTVRERRIELFHHVVLAYSTAQEG
ncbi:MULTISPECIES: TetR/AcrR family transcriptional regulator [unclassified Nocardia]|uniref:TetR/AcrR family transcriptional regulator n=1 Tax=unclassified Nocardia TaxID=2637762 RepID=UPI001CE48720|nr:MULTISPECIES: TetR/AcrR family transcriptional regulator [unclassified Nocardia]